MSRCFPSETEQKPRLNDALIHKHMVINTCCFSMPCAPPGDLRSLYVYGYEYVCTNSSTPV